MFEAKAAGASLEAKAVIHEQLQALACEDLGGAMKNLTRCGGLALALQALDPNADEGETMLVHWVEDSLKRFDPPPPSKKEVSPFGGFTPEYSEWSLARGWSPEEAMFRELRTALLLNLLARIGDAKLVPIFRRGVNSNSSAILMMATVGLGLLHDTESVTAILVAASKLSDAEHDIVLAQLVCFNDPGVDRLMQTGVRDKNLTKEMAKEMMDTTRPRPQIIPGLRKER